MHLPQENTRVGRIRMQPSPGGVINPQCARIGARSGISRVAHRLGGQAVHVPDRILGNLSLEHVLASSRQGAYWGQLVGHLRVGGAGRGISYHVAQSDRRDPRTFC